MLDLDVVDAAVKALTNACRPHGAEISYAAKAFLCTGFARFLCERDIGIDVCSLGELLIAERAGYDAARITFHGAGKSDDELEAIAAGRCGRVAVDGLDELGRLASIARGRGVNLLVRLNTGVAADTHAAVCTAGGDTKFGLHQRDERAAAEVLRAHANLRFTGVHAHLGSDIGDARALAAHAAALTAGAARFAERGFPSRELVAGGGFSNALDVAATIDAMARAIAGGAAANGIPVPRLGIEPGRAVVARAGTSLYRVVAIKRQATRTFVVIDGGLADNPRPALYDAVHPVVPVEASSGDDVDVTLCGRSCENDEMGVARLPEDLRAGDLLAMQTTGAYTFSMASNYNRFVRPAVVGVENGRTRLLVRRETYDDVLRTDEP